MESINLLRTNLTTVLSIQGEWPIVRQEVKRLIQESLQKVTEVSHVYSENELLFDTSCISDKNTLDILKLYRQIAASLRYSSDKNYKRLLPKIQSLSALKDSLQTKEKNSDLFMKALQQCRASQNRIICKYNDRGCKASYIQTFDYELNKVTNVVSAFKEYDSAYKNYCLYIAINKICNTEAMLLQTLRGICEQRYDIFRNESECWAGAMCALKIIDYHYLTNTLTNNSTSLIRLCLLLLNIYIKYHSGKDRLRTMGCYANRSRLNERLYKSNYFYLAISDYSERIKTNPILSKYLCMYDLEQAKKLTPHELVGEYAENYNYFASQLMMYQNQGLGIVLPEGGDAFDAPWYEIIMLGEGVSNEITNNLERMIVPIFDDFSSKYMQTLFQLQRLIESYYQDMNVGKDTKITHFCCLSWVHQLESYSHFGMVKAKFTPIKYRLEDFLQNVQINKCKIEGPNICDTGKKYLIHDFNKSPQMYKVHNEYPFINQISILTDNNDNIKAFRCYGHDFKEWIEGLCRYHSFYGIAVRPFEKELHKLPETVNLIVCFQKENDINL